MEGPYCQRMNATQQPVLKKLFRIMNAKKSNLCVAANFKTIEETLEFVDRCGEHICCLKTQTLRYKGHLEDNLKLLYEKKKQHDFLLFEDLKFHDGDETVESIYTEKFLSYADIVTVIGDAGDAIFAAIRQAAAKQAAELAARDEPRACLAVCDFSFAGFKSHTEYALEASIRNKDICCGLISQRLRVPDEDNMIVATPGVHMSRSAEGAQRWNQPSQVIEAGADMIIVGRGITEAPAGERERVVLEYKNAGWEAKCREYELRRKSSE